MTDGDDMVNIRLKHIVEDVDRHGNVRLYVRRKGHPKIRIRAVPGTEEFQKAYSAALKGISLGLAGQARALPRAPATQGSLRWLIEQYYGSAEFKTLEASTQHVRGLLLDNLCEESISDDDPTPIASLKYAIPEQKIRVLRDRKAERVESANGRLKALRHLFTYAVAAKLMATNPAKAVPYIRTKKKGGFHTWSLDEVAAFERCHPVGSKARLALALFLYTGQRRSDAATLGRQHIRGPEQISPKLRAVHPGRWLHFTQYKGRNSKPVTLMIPILPVLEAVMTESPCGDLTFLVTEFGKPFTHAGLGNWFADRCKEAGVPGRAHGLRKAGAVIAAENGATANQLMAIFGWKTMKQAALYTEAAEQKRLAGAAMSLISRDQTGNESVPLSSVVEKSGTKKR